MTSAYMSTEKAGYRYKEYPEEPRGTMVNRNPRVKDIISGIILLAARGKEPMPLKKVHTVIHAMKSHEPILSGLRFSLTGAVCYSRDIDQAINFLADGRFLKIIDGSAFLGESAPAFWTYLSGYLTNSQIQAVHSASLRFHERVRREVKGSRDRA